MEEPFVYLVPKTTVSPNYLIYTPLTSLVFNTGDTTLQSINMDKFSQNPNSCTINLVLNEQTKELLTDFYSKMRILNSDKNLNDIVLSPYIHCSFSIDKLKNIDGSSLQLGRFTDLINKNVRANVQLYAIHSVTKQDIVTTFPVFVTHDLTLVLDP